MTAAVILAAGAGKRMHSDLPKVMHPVLGRPMVLRVADTASSCGFDRIVAVVGHGRERLVPLLDGCGIGWVVQERQLGTAHAVSCAIGSVEADEYAILLGDVPLLRADTVVSLMEARRTAGASMAVLTAEAPDPAGYGRIVRKTGNLVDRIVEERDADDAVRSIREINTGVMAFEGRALGRFIARIGNGNSQGEYYLTDAAALASADGTGCAACLAPGWEEVAGVNDPFQLAEASRALSRRNVERLTASGVRFTDPSGVWIEDGVTAACGSEIGRVVRLSGNTSLGEDSAIGDGSIIEDAAVPSGAVLPPYTVILRGGGLG